MLVLLKNKDMANHCFTTYKILGTEKAVKDLFTTIEALQTTVKGLDECSDSDFLESILKTHGLENVFEDLKTQTTIRLWLGDLAEHYGINCEEREINDRGHICFVKYETIEKEDKHLLTVKTDTAWIGCSSLFNAINEVLGDELSISYREWEWGTEYFCVHDEGGFFPEECIALGLGKPFEELYYAYFDTIEAAIHEWCFRMGVERGCKSQEEMVDYIHNYVYKDEDTYFVIYEIYIV